MARAPLTSSRATHKLSQHSRQSTQSHLAGFYSTVSSRRSPFSSCMDCSPRRGNWCRLSSSGWPWARSVCRSQLAFQGIMDTRSLRRAHTSRRPTRKGKGRNPAFAVHKPRTFPEGGPPTFMMQDEDHRAFLSTSNSGHNVFFPGFP